MLHIGRCTLAVTMDLTERKITKIAREASKLAVRTLKEDGIGTAEYDFIHLVRHHPGITQAEVREQLRVDKGAAARRAASLEAKGYLIRQANPKDGRSQLLFATEKAEGLRNSKAQVETTFYEWLLAELPEAEKAAFCKTLDTIYRRSKQESRAGFPHITALTEQGEGVTVVGCIPYAAPGEGMTVTGVWITHPLYGPQITCEQVERRMKAGPAWRGWNTVEEQKTWLVFTTEFGNHYCPQTVYAHFKKIARQIGAEKANVHSLRHTYAVLCLQNGDDVKTVQSNLGHATAAFTLDVYGHVSEKMKQDSANRMEAYMRGTVYGKTQNG